MPYNKKENQLPVETLEMYLCIRRRKDNGRLGHESMFRQIIRNEHNDLVYCRDRISRSERGVWRIYKTVNPRSVKKAFRVFFNRMVEEMFDGLQNAHRMDSLWKTCLLQPQCRAEKNFLIDCDTMEAYHKFLDWTKTKEGKECKIRRIQKTPNGVHVVTHPFNKTLLNIPDLEINPDGFEFVELIEVE